MALVVVVPGPGGLGGSRSASGTRPLGALSKGPLSVGPLSVGPGLRRTDPVQRIVTTLSSSVRAVRGAVPRAGDVAVLDFADLFAAPPAEGDAAASYPGAGASTRQEGTAAADDVAELAEELLRGWWTSASRIGQFEAYTDRRRRPMLAGTLFPAPAPAPAPATGAATGPGGPADPVGSAGLGAALGTSTYFRGSPELADAEARALARYLTDLKLRHEVRDRAQAAILPGTQVVIGHGLGAVIAYEALCALSDAVSVAFVSLGAAMCGPRQVFARLEPAPRNEQGHWPASIRRWSNVVAHSDPTAMITPRLTELFGPGIEDEVIEIKTSCGDLNAYLQDRATGRAMAAGLAG